MQRRLHNIYEISTFIFFYAFWYWLSMCNLLSVFLLFYVSICFHIQLFTHLFMPIGQCSISLLICPLLHQYLIVNFSSFTASMGFTLCLYFSVWLFQLLNYDDLVIFCLYFSVWWSMITWSESTNYLFLYRNIL